jgi:hypothetical protein
MLAGRSGHVVLSGTIPLSPLRQPVHHVLGKQFANFILQALWPAPGVVEFWGQEEFRDGML